MHNFDNSFLDEAKKNTDGKENRLFRSRLSLEIMAESFCEWFAAFCPISLFVHLNEWGSVHFQW